jgi:hypothetical protein
MQIVHRLVKGEDGDHADVRHLTRESSEGCIMVERGDRQPIEDENDVLHTQKPHVGGGAGAIHDNMGESFDLLPLSFSVVLVLVLGFTLPVFDDEGTQDIKNSFTGFNGNTITDEFVHSTALTNIILEGTDELIHGFHTIYVDNMGVSTDEDLRVFVITKCRHRAGDGVGGNRFVTAVNVEGRERGFVGVTYVGSQLRSGTAVLGGMVVCLANKVGIFPEEELLERGKVTSDGRNFMGVDQLMYVTHVQHIVDGLKRV